MFNCTNNLKLSSSTSLALNLPNNSPGEREDSQDTNENAHTQIFCLNKSPHRLLFEETIKKGVFNKDSNFLMNIDRPMPPLLDQSASQLIREFTSSGINDLLLHLEKKYSLIQEEAFKIVGSFVFWITGIQYSINLYKEFDINLYDFFSEAALKEIFERPADVDIRVDFSDLSLEELKKVGKEITSYIAEKHPTAITKKMTISNGMNCIYVVSVTLYGKKYDINLVSKLHKQFLFGEDDLYIPISPSLIEEGTKNLKFNLKGKNYFGWHAILLRLMRTKWTDCVNAINVPGSLKFLLSSIKAYTCFSQQFEERLFKNFLSILQKPEGPETAIEALHKSVNSHMPGHPSAFTAFCFNLHYLFNFYRPENWESSCGLLFQELRHKSRTDEMAIQKQEISALHEILKNSLMPFELLSAYLLIQGLLLESRKKYSSQNEILSLSPAETGGRPIIHLKFVKEGVTLTLPSDPLNAVQMLKSYFIDQKFLFSKDALRLLKTLSNPFFPPLEISTTNISKFNHFKYNSEIAKEITSIAIDLLESEHTQVLGFLLLCHCGEILMSSENFALLSALLPDLLIANPDSIRNAIFLHFIRFYQACKPSDTLFIDKIKISKFSADILAKNSSTEVDILTHFCSFFAHADDINIHQSVSKAWEKLSGKLAFSTYMNHGKMLIKGYLSNMNGLVYALKILSKMAQSKQTHYHDLSSLYCDIYARANLQSPSDGLRFYKVCLMILLKDKQGTGKKIPCLPLVDFLLKNYLTKEALELLNEAEKKQLKPSETSFKRLYISQILFSKNQWQLAYLEWEKAFRSEPNEALTILFKWKSLLDEEIREDHLDETFFERKLGLFKCLALACNSKIANQNIASLLQVIIDEIQSFELIKKGSSKNDLISLLRQQGKWLFEEIYVKNNVLTANSNITKTYRNIFQHLDIKNLDSSVVNYFGAHTIIQVALVSQQMDESVSDLASKLLSSSTLEIKMIGFLLRCQDKDFLQTSQAFNDLCIQLISILCSSPSIPICNQVLEYFTQAFPHMFVDVSVKDVQENLLAKNTKQTAMDLGTFLLRLPSSEIPQIFLKFWLLDKSPEMGLIFIKLLFSHSPLIAKEIAKALEQSSTLPADDLEQMLLSIFESKPWLADKGKEMRENLTEITLLYLKNCKKQTHPDLKEQINEFIIYLITHFFQQGIKLFKEVEKKEFFNNNTLDFLRLSISERHSELQNFDEAINFWIAASNEKIEQTAINLLITWENKISPIKYMELLFCVLKNSPSELILQKIISNLNVFLENTELQKLLTAHLNIIFSSLKDYRNVSLLNKLLSHLLACHVDPLALLDKYNLYELLLDKFEMEEIRKEIEIWAIQAIKAKKDIKSISKIPQAQAFYLKLAETFGDKDLNIQIYCVNNALTSIRNASWPSLLNLSFCCLESLIEANRINESLNLLSKIEKYFPESEPIKLLSFWLKIIYKLESKASNTAIPIYTKIAPQFEKYHLLHQLAVPAASFCEFLIKNNTCIQEALNIAFLCKLDINFWTAALPLLSLSKSLSYELLLKLSYISFAKASHEVGLWWEIYLSYSLKNDKKIFIHLLSIYKDILDNLENSNYASEDWEKHPFYLLLIGFISLLGSMEKEKQKESLCEAIEILESRLISHQSKASASLCCKNILQRLLATKSEIGLELASNKLLNFKLFPIKNPQIFITECLNQFCFFDQFSEDITGKNLQEIIFGEKTFHNCFFLEEIEPIAFLDFLSRLQNLSYLIDHSTFIFNLLSQLTFNFSPYEIKRERLAAIFDRIIFSCSHSGLTCCHQILEHPGLELIFSEEELSHQWALYLNNYLNNLGAEGLMACLMSAHHITHLGIQELKFLDLLTESILFNYLNSNDIEQFKSSLSALLRKFSRHESKEKIERWNQQTVFTKHNFGTFINLMKDEPIDENLKNETHRHLNEIVELFKISTIIEKNSGSSEIFAAFVDLLHQKTAKIKTDNMNVQCFLLANLFFFQEQLTILFRNDPNKYYNMIYEICFRYLPIHDNFYRLHCENVGYLLLIAGNTLPASPSPLLLFQLSLFLTKDYEQVSMLPPRQKQEAVSDLIIRLCKDSCPQHAYQALEILKHTNKNFFSSSPELLQLCYIALIKYAKTYPFLIIEEPIPQTENSRLSTPLLYYLGNVIIESCYCSFNDKDDINFMSKKYQAVMSNLFCSYFHLAKECLFEENSEERFTWDNILLSLPIGGNVPSSDEIEKIKTFKEHGYVTLSMQYYQIQDLPFMREHHCDKLLYLLEMMMPLALEDPEYRSSFFINFINIWQNTNVSKSKELLRISINKWVKLLNENGYLGHANEFTRNLVYKAIME